MPSLPKDVREFKTLGWEVEARTVTVETITHLWCHVREQERFIHVSLGNPQNTTQSSKTQQDAQ